MNLPPLAPPKKGSNEDPNSSVSVVSLEKASEAKAFLEVCFFILFFKT